MGSRPPHRLPIVVDPSSGPLLAADWCHVGVTAAGKRLDRIERRDLLRRQHESIRTQLLVQALNPLRTRNGSDVLALRKDPRERNLRRRCIGLLRDGLAAAMTRRACGTRA
jgi:hypothetical protein